MLVFDSLTIAGIAIVCVIGAVMVYLTAADA